MPLSRSQALRSFSVKRLAALEANGQVPFSTFTNPAKARTSTRTTSARPRSTGPDALTVATLRERDFGRCGWCGRDIDPASTRGFDWSVSHRRPRRAGGDPRPETNLPGNLVLVHGHALSLCHLEIEDRRSESLDRGHLLHDVDVPCLRAIDHAVHGWVYLTDDGDWSYDPPEVAA